MEECNIHNLLFADRMVCLARPFARPSGGRRDPRLSHHWKEQERVPSTIHHFPAFLGAPPSRLARFRKQSCASHCVVLRQRTHTDKQGCAHLEILNAREWGKRSRWTYGPALFAGLEGNQKECHFQGPRPYFNTCPHRTHDHGL